MIRTVGDKRFIGKTNAEAARAGYAPQLHDGHIIRIHHVGQKGSGPLVEASSQFHDFKNPKAFKSIHNQFTGKQKHPTDPVNHEIWSKEQKNYWQQRTQND
jgi:hypothetical protein